MRYIITESQYRKILEAKYQNFKPSREFDKIYGTNLGQTWDFGDNLTSDDVWDSIESCILHEDCDKLNSILDNMDEKMFPYPGIEKLDYGKKFDILQGMASEFNYDDIVHFVIKGRTGLNDKNFNKFHNSLDDKQRDHVQWITSPKTLKIVKKALKK